ncbi:aminotransferase class I/II-fold pyridoxal phosphate-dependent enzyme [Jatrophihabitans sp.]|uniref:aminotransferase class I/II-fold pyridoxal phosphate-dependent enzyme n=1 Tax=Jatrophihabitans sp. TaxID=1932789 RepID=UPI002EED11E0
MIRTSDPVWQGAADRGLIDIRADPQPGNAFIVRETGHEFLNMCSCSYLGLNFHPAIIEGAIQALREAGTTGPSISATRIRHNLLGRMEEDLSDLFGAHVLSALSCSVATAALLPLLASGQLVAGGPRVMVFDRNCHFNMNYVKPICADESLVLTCDHNDLDAVEDICRRYPSVAFVGDGVYSMGGAAALRGLLELQERYGMFLFLDDSHSLSIMGEHGEGFVRSQLEMNELTAIVGSLGKGFGTGGGVIMLGDRGMVSVLARHGGPLGWSQGMGISLIGATMASAAIHRTPELGELQRRLRANIDYFDELLPTPLAGNGLPVRRVTVGDTDRALQMSAELYERGFYNSAVFFPIVAKGDAGIRIMLRSDVSREQLSTLTGYIRELSP